MSVRFNVLVPPAVTNGHVTARMYQVFAPSATSWIVVLLYDVSDEPGRMKSPLAVRTVKFVVFAVLVESTAARPYPTAACGKVMVCVALLLFTE